ncbi:hypothetical protein HAX54_020916 [Datura stramonium]|uniref:Uncharacterized protein n=1 Tax=Datura stramonium TaxID=4076 RepID=A0ABS8S546_DATST|nr:hypothetical protein [Datura stramonium]
MHRADNAVSAMMHKLGKAASSTMCTSEGALRAAKWSKRERVKKGQNFGFGGLLTRFLRGHDIEEEEANYRPTYDPRGIDVTKNKEPEGINCPVPIINEQNVRIDNMLSHLYGMQML